MDHQWRLAARRALQPLRGLDAQLHRIRNLGTRILQKLRGIALAIPGRRQYQDAHVIKAFLYDLYPQNVAHIAWNVVDTREPHTFRADEDFLFAAKHSGERTQSQGHLFDLTLTPIIRESHQITRAVTHQGHEIVPERGADDLVEAAPSG